MKEGFYFHTNYVYYGCYDEDQVSGRGMISAVKKEYIRTDNPIPEKEWAVRLWDNHGLLEPEYEEQGVLVFFKKKRTPIAGYDLKGGCLARYYKKEWDIDKGDVCFYQFCVSRIFTMALENKPALRKGRCKGKFVTTLNIKRELENYCTNGYHLILEYDVYGIAMMYSDAGLMAWIRSNGSYADIHVGAEKESDIDAFGDHLGEVVWN